MKILEIEIILESFDPKDLDALEKFMIDGLLVKNMHPTKLASVAYHQFKNSVYGFNDWEWVTGYYSSRLWAIEFLRKQPDDGYVVGNSHDDSCDDCKDNINNKVYSVKNVPALPCCEFCRCRWTTFMPDMSYIKDGKVQFVLNNEMEAERVSWIKKNRKLFKRKYEKPNFTDESGSSKRRSEKFLNLLIENPERIKYLIENDRDTLKKLIDE